MSPLQCLSRILMDSFNPCLLPFAAFFVRLGFIVLGNTLSLFHFLVSDGRQ